MPDTNATDPAPPGRRLWPLVIAGIGMVLIVVLAAGALVAAGGGGDRHGNASASHPTAVAPLELASVSAALATHYRFAKAHPAELTQLPCYCGCATFLRHRNLLDCFVRADGRGWEAHASGCGVCIAEVTAAEALVAAHKTPSEIRDAIVAQFGATPATAPTTAPSA